MGTSNSDRFASSGGIFLGLDPRIVRIKRKKKKKKTDGEARKRMRERRQLRHISHVRSGTLIKGSWDGIKGTYNLMPMR